jgi:hypothetical protein
MYNFLHHFVNFSLLGPNILLATLFKVYRNTDSNWMIYVLAVIGYELNKWIFIPGIVCKFLSIKLYPPPILWFLERCWSRRSTKLSIHLQHYAIMDWYFGLGPTFQYFFWSTSVRWIYKVEIVSYQLSQVSPLKRLSEFRIYFDGWGSEGLLEVLLPEFYLSPYISNMTHLLHQLLVELCQFLSENIVMHTVGTWWIIYLQMWWMLSEIRTKIISNCQMRHL